MNECASHKLQRAGFSRHSFLDPTNRSGSTRRISERLSRRARHHSRCFKDHYFSLSCCHRQRKPGSHIAVGDHSRSALCSSFGHPLALLFVLLFASGCLSLDSIFLFFLFLLAVFYVYRVARNVSRTCRHDLRNSMEIARVSEIASTERILWSRMSRQISAHISISRRIPETIKKYHRAHRLV